MEPFGITVSVILALTIFYITGKAWLQDLSNEHLAKQNQGTRKYIPENSYKKLAAKHNWSISYDTLMGTYKDLQFQADFYQKSWEFLFPRQEKFVPAMQFIKKTAPFIHEIKNNELPIIKATGDNRFDASIAVLTENEIFTRAFLTTVERQLLLSIFEEATHLDVTSKPGKIIITLLPSQEIYGKIIEENLLSILELAHLLINTSESVIGLMETLLRDQNLGIIRQTARLAFTRFFTHNDFLLYKNDLLNHKNDYLNLLSALFFKSPEMFPLIAQQAENKNIHILEDYLYITKHHNNPADLDNLRSIYLMTKSETIKELTAQSMEKIGDPQSGPFLLSALSKAVTPSTRKAIIKALGPCGNEETLPILRKLQKSTVDEELLATYNTAINAILTRIDTKEHQGMLSITEIDTNQGKLSLK